MATVSKPGSMSMTSQPTIRDHLHNDTDGHSKSSKVETHVTPVVGDLKPSEISFPLPRSKQSSSPLRQSLLPWILAVITVIVYVLTVCYALGNTGLRYLSFTSLNPSRSLALIRTLSEVTSLCLVFLINMCADRMLWMLIARKEGTSLPTFLALHYGSGIWSWLQLIVRNAKGGRVLSWSRILISIAIPVMGIVLLSEVKIELSFDEHTSFPVAAGIGNFDPSYAEEYSQVAATFMATDFSSLLQFPNVVWPVSVIGTQNSNCTTDDIFSNNICGKGYFLHGGLDLVTPWPTEDKSMPSYLVYTIDSLRGVQLDFTALPPNTNFSPSTDCLVFGTDSNAFQICISQNTPNSINARITVCPITITGSCLKDSSWLTYPGWTTTLTTHARHATVHFSRSNLTAISMTSFSPEIEYTLSAKDLLTVYNTTFNARTGLGRPLDSAQQLVTYITTHLLLGETSTQTSLRALSSFHNLLAMPLYYFQPTYLSPYTHDISSDKVLSNLPADQGLYTTAGLATYYYGLVIAPWSVYLYAIVMGVLVLMCVVVLGLGSLKRFAGGVPNTTAWPFVDVIAECCVRDGVSEMREDKQEVKGVGNAVDEGWYRSARRIKDALRFKEKAVIIARMKVKLI